MTEVAGIPCRLFLCMQRQQYSCKISSFFIVYRVKVFSDGDFLHNIQEKQFLDSPEWESFSQNETSDNFQVRLVQLQPKDHANHIQAI